MPPKNSFDIASTLPFEAVSAAKLATRLVQNRIIKNSACFWQCLHVSSNQSSVQYVPLRCMFWIAHHDYYEVFINYNERIQRFKDINTDCWDSTIWDRNVSFSYTPFVSDIQTSSNDGPLAIWSSQAFSSVLPVTFSHFFYMEQYRPTNIGVCELNYISVFPARNVESWMMNG